MEELTKENYYDSSYVSNSSLNWILPETGGSAKKYEYFSTHPQPELDSEAIRLGKLIHLYVEKKTFDVFQICSVPSPSIKAVCDLILETGKGITNDTILEAANKLDYQKSWKPETKIQKILDEGLGYMASIETAKANGKTLVSFEELSKLQLIGEEIKNAVPELFESSTSEKYILNEYPISFLYYPADTPEVRCKALIDVIVVDDSNNTVTIYDIKTSNVPNSIYLGYNDVEIQDKKLVFKQVEGTYIKRNVHRQMAFYKLACESKWPSYKMQCKIIAVETNAPYEVSVKKIIDETLKIGMYKIEQAMNLLNNHKLVGYDL